MSNIGDPVDSNGQPVMSPTGNVGAAPTSENINISGSDYGPFLEQLSKSQQPNTSDGLSLLLKLLAGGGSAIAGNMINQNASQNAVPPQVSQLLQMGVDRTAYQNPLSRAATQGAFSMLPDFAKSGIGAPGSQSAPAPQQGGSSMMPLAAGAGAAGLAAALLQPNSPLLAALKKLFPSGTPAPPTSPYGGGGVGDQGPQNPGLAGGGGYGGVVSDGSNATFPTDMTYFNRSNDYPGDPTNRQSFIKGNPNAFQFDPYLAAAAGGTGAGQLLGEDVLPKVKAV